MAEANPRVSVGVVPRSRWSLSVPSLVSLLETLPDGVELVYVDGGAPDAISAELRAMVEGHGGKFLRYDYVLICNEARNILISETSGEYLVFVENDVDFRPGWLEALVDCADETGAGAVQPLILMGSDGDTELIHIGAGEIQINNRVLDLNIHEHEWTNLSDVPKQTRRPTGQMEFHTFLTRRTMLDDIGPFDEEVRALADHEDFVLTALAGGWELYYEPASEIVFMQFAYLTEEDRPFWQLHWSEPWHDASLARFCEKWDLRDDEGWTEMTRRWSSKRRTMWYHGTNPVLSNFGKVLGKLIYLPATSRVFREFEWRVMCGPGREADKTRRAALGGDQMPAHAPARAS